MLVRAVARGQLVHEPPPGFVVAGVRREETLAAAGEFLLAICLEGLDPLVVRSSTTFVLEARLMQPVMRDPFGEASGAHPKVLYILAQGGVEQSNPHGLARADRAKRRPR